MGAMPSWPRDPVVERVARLVADFDAYVDAVPDDWWPSAGTASALAIQRRWKATTLSALIEDADYVDGLRRGATPPPPVTGDASERTDLPPLPASLEAALTAFRADDAAVCVQHFDEFRPDR